VGGRLNISKLAGRIARNTVPVVVGRLLAKERRMLLYTKEYGAISRERFGELARAGRIPGEVKKAIGSPITKRYAEEVLRSLGTNTASRAASKTITVGGTAAYYYHIGTANGSAQHNRYEGDSLKSCLMLGAQVRALVNHDDGREIGSIMDGSLRLREARFGTGIEFELDLAADSEIALKVQLGEIRKVSPATGNHDEAWVYEQGVQIRSIRRADLVEISLLDGLQPGFLGTSVKVIRG
jgi:phage head maturation protease